MNLYGYVGGMPLMLVDPMGLSAMEAMRQRHELGLVREDSIELASDTMDAMERPLQTAWCNRHAILDYFAYWPAVDMGADLLHAIVYALEGDWGNAGFHASTFWIIGPVGKLKHVPGNHLHHVLPQADEFQDFFRRAGIENIDNYLASIPEDIHRWMHSGPHGSGGMWNAAWRAFMNANPSANAEQVLDFGTSLLRKMLQ